MYTQDANFYANVIELNLTMNIKIKLLFGNQIKIIPTTSFPVIIIQNGSSQIIPIMHKKATSQYDDAHYLSVDLDLDRDLDRLPLLLSRERCRFLSLAIGEGFLSRSRSRSRSADRERLRSSLIGEESRSLFSMVSPAI